MAQPKVEDVERIKKKVRKMAAAKVLAGDSADAYLSLGRLDGCQVYMRAGFGPKAKAPRPLAQDRLIWVLDGSLEIEDLAGRVTYVSQGESAVLRSGAAYRFTFPQLCLYLSIDAEAQR